MARNGSGTYIAPASSWNPGINGVAAATADWNALLADIVAALTQSISRDGQAAYTGNQPMASFKLTGLGAGSVDGDSLRFEQVFASATEQTPLIRLIPPNAQTANYTAVLSDGGKFLLHPSADASARTFTIPANASVTYPIGTALTFINQNGAGVVTIAITTDTLRWAGNGATGSRTLAANGIATAIKIAASEWLISGTGLT